MKTAAATKMTAAKRTPELQPMEAWIEQCHADNKRLGLVAINAWIARYNDDDLEACRLMKEARAKIISQDIRVNELQAALRSIVVALDAGHSNYIVTAELDQARAALAKVSA